MSGYRRPKNLRDILVRAVVSPKIGDQEADASHTAIPQPPVVPDTTAKTKEGSLQKSITDFFRRVNPLTRLRSKKITATPQLPATTPNQRMGSSNKELGFSFCNKQYCRYCPKLNKTGTIYCTVTDSTHRCMKNVSCRSSNLIYAITCNRCGMQYVGQTMLRLKDRFVHHFHDIDIADKEKTRSKHFSQSSHNGFNDLQITVLEFIKKPPRSPQAVVIRNRVEKRWTHLLRSLAPFGLNIENPKEFQGKHTKLPRWPATHTNTGEQTRTHSHPSIHKYLH